MQPARKPIRRRAGPLLLKRASAVLALVAFAAGAAETVDVAIEGYKFMPAEVTIRVGDSVRWSNREKRTSHSVLFPSENALESPRLFPGEDWQRAFDKPGVFDYRCGPHEEMKGRVVVE